MHESRTPVQVHRMPGPAAWNALVPGFQGTRHQQFAVQMLHVVSWTIIAVQSPLQALEHEELGAALDCLQGSKVTRDRARATPISASAVSIAAIGVQHLG